ncbi:MAG: acyl carrier protein [Chloroflexota bacterium]
MKTQTVEETVKKIVAKVVRQPDLNFTPTATFKDFQADSLDIVQIMVAVEDTFEIEIPDDELKSIADMGGFVSLIEKKIAQKEGKK